LTYIHTGVAAALLLNAQVVDFAVGGCGTGQGFLNSVMQYPNVFCGHILNSLDAWLFTQINSGNCISLALNQGYGWAGAVNLRFIFDRIFSVERGAGYPSHRKESQQESRLLLEKISVFTHVSFAEILERLPDHVVQPVLSFPHLQELLLASAGDPKLKNILSERALPPKTDPAL
jgi:ribose 5-phosphate isomerase RpiB